MNFLRPVDSTLYQSGKIDLFVLNKEYLFIIYAILLVFYMQAKRESSTDSRKILKLSEITKEN